MQNFGKEEPRHARDGKGSTAIEVLFVSSFVVAS